MLYVTARALSGLRTELFPYASSYPGFLSGKEKNEGTSGLEALCTVCFQALNATARRLETLLRGDRANRQSTALQRPDNDATRIAAKDLVSLLSLPEKGTLLHFEAGNGAFLERFHAIRPQWELSAIESGPAFMDLLDKDFLSSATNADYRDADICRHYDIIVVTKPLDFLNKPLEAVRWLSRRLTETGTLYLRQPFPVPAASLCGALHGVHIRISSLTTLCTAAGLTVRETTTKDNTICVCAYKEVADTPRAHLGGHIL